MPCCAGRTAEQLGVGVRQAQRHLADLAKHGLAKKLAKGLWRGVRVSMPELDRLAEKLGVRKASRRQRERHRSERTRYRQWHGTFHFPFGRRLKVKKSQAEVKNKVLGERVV